MEAVEMVAAAVAAEADVAAAAEASRLWAIAETFDLTDVRERFRGEHQLSASAAQDFERECKRFLVLCAIHPSLSMRGPVDEFWHTFLLFTRKYAEFCDQVAGKFIHHDPDVPGQKVERQGIEHTFAVYREAFGEEPPMEIWNP